MRPGPGLGCPVCGSNSWPYLVRPDTSGSLWQLNVCECCRHGFVVNRPSKEELASFYAEARPGETQPPRARHHSREAWEEAERMAGAIARLSPGRGLVLDVGAGEGGFSSALVRQGFRVHLLDAHPGVAEVAAGIPGSVSTCSTFEAFVSCEVFEAVLMSQVLEHAQDPAEWLAKARRLLAPSGLLAVAVPNFGGLYRILGTQDPFLIFPKHLNYFTPQSLSLAVKSAGLCVVEVRSSSLVAVRRPNGVTPVLRQIAAKVWNPMSRVWDRGCRGIILQAFARRVA